MNNVWTAIAFRAPCAARQVQVHRKPLLRLFNGYARSISTYNGRSATSRPSLKPSEFLSRTSNNGNGNAFTTSAILSGRSKSQRAAAKIKKTRTSPSKPEAAISKAFDAKLEAPPIAASYTEGVESGQLTWRDYDPVGGMPLPSGELSQPMINSVFDSERIDEDTGNYILSVMYWRRMSGALIDSGLDFPNDSGVTREQALKGLEYVRSLDPGFDEEAAGAVWAGEETLRLQEQLRDRAVQLKLYKAEQPEEAEQDQAQEPSDQGTEYGRSRTQDSQLLRLRQENIARNEREEAAQKAQQDREELAAFRKHRGPLELAGGVQPPTGIARHTPGGIIIRPPQDNAWLQPVERKDWVKRYEKRATILTDDRIPQIPLLARLGPSFLFMLAVLALATFVSETYTPPPRSARMFPDTPPAVATLGTLIGGLTTAFLLSRLPPLWRTFNKFFTLVPAYPYAVSILGAALRHQPLTHLVSNCVSLGVFGLILHEDVGRGTFLSIFAAAGAVGGMTALTYNVLVRNWATYIFGASSCVLGVMAAACVLRPNGTMSVGGYEVPVATWLFLAIYAGAQVVVAVRGSMPGIDHAGHMGGLVTGIVAALLLRWRARKAAAEQSAGETGMMTAQTGVVE